MLSLEPGCTEEAKRRAETQPPWWQTFFFQVEKKPEAERTTGDIRDYRRTLAHTGRGMAQGGVNGLPNAPQNQGQKEQSFWGMGNIARKKKM